MIEIVHKNITIASFFKDNNQYAITYKNDLLSKSISLSMPNTKKLYTFKHRFPPYLETFLPEGYLYEIFKNIIAKEHGEVNDYLIFSLLASNIESRITFKGDLDSLRYSSIDIDYILQNDKIGRASCRERVFRAV